MGHSFELLREFPKPSAFHHGGPVSFHLPKKQTAELWSSLSSVLALPVASHVEGRSVAFVTPNGIVYPETVGQAEELAKCCTSVVQRLEEYGEPFTAIADSLTTTDHPRITVTAYVSRDGSHRLGWHVDKWDNYVLQLEGSKTFKFESGERHLAAGDCLAIPQDVLHRVSTRRHSVHLSVVLLRSEGTRHADGTMS